MAYYHEEEEEEDNYPNSVVSILQKQRDFGRPGHAGISHISYIGSHNQHGHTRSHMVASSAVSFVVYYPGYRGALEQLERRRYVLA